MAELGTGGANGAHFGVGGGVVTGQDAVPAFGNDLAVAYDDGAERAAFARFAADTRQFDGARQEKIIGVHVLALVMLVCKR